MRGKRNFSTLAAIACQGVPCLVSAGFAPHAGLMTGCVENIELNALKFKGIFDVNGDYFVEPYEGDVPGGGFDNHFKWDVGVTADDTDVKVTNLKMDSAVTGTTTFRVPVGFMWNYTCEYLKNQYQLPLQKVENHSINIKMELAGHEIADNNIKTNPFRMYSTLEGAVDTQGNVCIKKENKNMLEANINTRLTVELVTPTPEWMDKATKWYQDGIEALQEAKKTHNKET